MKIGVISDTHGLFDESITSIFARVDAMIHAGDIGQLEVIARLEKIAPVFAVEGNNDSFGRFPLERASVLRRVSPLSHQRHEAPQSFSLCGFVS
ncbi:MAG: metallophosphoesterase family protein [Blastocatellia bacterium]